MARYSEHGTQAIYEAAERFRDECLRKDGSLLFGAESVWTRAHLQHLHSVFVDAPDESDRRFIEKFRDQIQPTGQPVTRLAAEVVAVYFLFPSNVTGHKKRHVVNEILSWSGDSLPADHLVSRAFDHGLGSGGQGYNTRRPNELSFLIELALAWKSLDTAAAQGALADPWAFQEQVDSIDGAENRQLRHMLLHLLFPNHFERIASGDHKQRVDAAFRGLVTDPIEDRDRRIYAIRRELERLLPERKLDFYGPPLDAAWDQASDSGDGLAPFDIIQHKKQVVLYGPPGTGKTFRAKQLAAQIVRSAALTQWGAARYFREQDRVEQATRQNVHRLQLHPAYSYEDFIRGLHITEGGATEYRLGHLPQLVRQMQEEGEDRLPHVLILDEINRTDLTRMLGECFSLLEDRDEEIELPGNDGPMRLSIPADLYVIGTMNLIDQSVEQIDFALRRRFLWVPCPFDGEALMEVFKTLWEEDPPRHNGWSRVAGDFDRLRHAAIELNQEIRTSPLLGPNYEIGHTYFFDVVQFLRKDLPATARGRKYYLWDRQGAMPSLKRLWRFSLRPLLHEYLAGLETSARDSELSRLEGVFLNATVAEE